MAGGVNLGGGDDEEITAINVTPLVDIMLVLLIIFMVASSYIVRNTIEVDLPKAATGGETLDTTLSIVIEADGDLFLNGEPTTYADIAAQCRKVAAQSDQGQAIIAADAKVTHDNVVRIIDLVRKNGVLKFGINVDPEVLKKVN